MSAALFLILAAAPSLTAVTSQGTPTPWLCAYAEERLPRAIIAAGGDALLSHEIGVARGRLGLGASPGGTRASALRIATWWGASSIVELQCNGEAPRVQMSARKIDVASGRVTKRTTTQALSANWAQAIDQLVEPLFETLRLPLLPRPSDEGVAGVAKALLLPPAEKRRALTKALASEGQFDEWALLAARAALQQSDPGAALSLATRLEYSSNVFGRELRFVRGVAELLSGMNSSAEGTFRAIDAGSTPGVLNNLALARMRQGGTDALDLMRRAVELDPSSPDLALNTALAQLPRSDPGAALFWAEGSLALSGPRGETLLAKSVALARLGKMDEAKTARALARAIDSVMTDAFRDDGPSLRRLERVFESERSVPSLRVRRSVSEQTATALRNAEELINRKQPEAALSPLRDLVYANPFEARAHHLIGRASFDLGRFDDARRSLETSLWCRPDDDARLDLVRTLLRLGDRSGASKLVAQIQDEGRREKGLSFLGAQQ